MRARTVARQEPALEPTPNRLTIEQGRRENEKVDTWLTSLCFLLITVKGDRTLLCHQSYRCHECPLSLT